MKFLLLLPLVLLAGCIGQPAAVVCTQDAKQCPDGSYAGRIPPTCDFAPCSLVNSTEPQDYFCTQEQEQAQSCVDVYSPVCGWFDSQKIQCVAYPCAQTFSNSCFACKDSKVVYWTVGACPKVGS